MAQVVAALAALQAQTKACLCLRKQLIPLLLGAGHQGLGRTRQCPQTQQRVVQRLRLDTAHRVEELALAPNEATPALPAPVDRAAVALVQALAVLMAATVQTEKPPTATAGPAVPGREPQPGNLAKAPAPRTQAEALEETCTNGHHTQTSPVAMVAAVLRAGAKTEAAERSIPGAAVAEAMCTVTTAAPAELAAAALW